MKKLLQIIINLLVVYMFVSLWIWPYIQSYFPYDDIITPEETLSFNEDVDAVLLNLDEDFQRMYQNRSAEDSVDLVRLNSQRILSDEENYETSVRSVVYISILADDGWIYFGAGTILSEDGVILTNHHNLIGAQAVVVSTFDGQHYPVSKVLASDESLDATILKIDAKNLRPIPIGDSNKVTVGEKTLVIGHPEGFLNTLSVGNVGGFQTYNTAGNEPQIQITNPISMGNSGGALLNEHGELIGIPTWSVEYDQNAVQVQNLNFAVPINEALSLLNQ